MSDTSKDGTGFKSGDNKTADQLPPGITVYNPGTGQTGQTDGNGGVFISR